jgi:hypothetical protein
VRARTAAPDPDQLDEELPGWDYADTFEVPAGTSRPATAGEAASAIFRLSPAGRRIMRFRDVLAGTVRLRSSSSTASGVLPVLRTAQQVCVLGMDDRHLDFRVVVELDHEVVRCTTVVRRHHLGGRLYFGVVRPFHRLAVPRLLAGAVDRGWAPPVGQEDDDA